ncbi:MAG TPA: OmpH family outer membrane protein [Pyrinomonadaceae bacterium]|nr:OmpH family outer membrane protein [Pyrinomonadaceae bacterium]
MRRFSFIAASFIFAAITAVSAFGQAAGPTAAFKMAVIDTGAFDAKDGITRYSTAMNALEAEFKPLETEIQGMVTKYNTLGADIKKFQDQAAAGTPIDQKSAQTKVEEYQNLELAIKRKQEDAKARAARREPQVMGPIRQEIGKALQDYAKQKGIALILDAAKLDGAGLILAFDEAKVDVTKDFIAFFNARPATTATTTTPR